MPHHYAITHKGRSPQPISEIGRGEIGAGWDLAIHLRKSGEVLSSCQGWAQTHEGIHESRKSLGLAK